MNKAGYQIALNNEENSTLQMYFLQQSTPCSQLDTVQWNVSGHSMSGLAQESCKLKPVSHDSSLVYFLFFYFHFLFFSPPPTICMYVALHYQTKIGGHFKVKTQKKKPSLSKAEFTINIVTSKETNI